MELLNEAGQKPILQKDFEEIFEFINDEFSKVLDLKEITQYEVQMLNLCNCLLRFGLYSFNDGQQTISIQKLSDYMFSIMHILFERNEKNFLQAADLEKLLLLKSLQSEQPMGDAQVGSDGSSQLSISNPVDRSTLDLKSQLFNKRRWSIQLLDSTLDDQRFTIKVTKELQNKIFDEKAVKRGQKIDRMALNCIVEVLHIFLDIRQMFYLQNFTSFFKREGITHPSLATGHTENVMVSLIHHINTVMPHNQKFQKVTESQQIQSLEELYNKFIEKNEDRLNEQLKSQKSISLVDKEFEFHKTNKTTHLSKTFIDLMLETFNNCQDDQYLPQMTLSLISRYQSETSEFLRNLQKSYLITDRPTLVMKEAMQFQLNLLVQNLQKSNQWTLMETAIPQIDQDELFGRLKKFKKLFLFEQQIDQNNPHDFKCVGDSKKRKVLRVYQHLFRCLKGYDVILNYLQHNKKLFFEVQRKLNYVSSNWASNPSSPDQKSQNLKVIQRIFKNCFKILEGFTRHNKKNQSLMWKYKEMLVYHKLGSIKQIGELDFLRQILQENQKIKLARNLENFVQLLNQRIDVEQKNSAVILGIYSNIIAYHDLPYVKKAVFQSIDTNPALRKLDERQEKSTFETGITILEILAFILLGDEDGKSKEILKKYFNFSTLIRYKDGVLRMIETYKQESLYYEEKVEDLKDRFLANLCYIYSSLYLCSSEYEEQEYKQVSEFLNVSLKEDISSKCEKYIAHFEEEKDSEKLRVSVAELKYLLFYSQVYFLDKIKQVHLLYNSSQGHKNDIVKGVAAGILNKVVSLSEQVGRLEASLQTLREHILQHSARNEDLQNLMKFLEQQNQILSNQNPFTAMGPEEDDHFYNSGSSYQNNSVIPMNRSHTLALTKAYKHNIQLMVIQSRDKPIRKLWKKFVYMVTRYQSLRPKVESESKDFGTHLFKRIKEDYLLHQAKDVNLKELKFIYNVILYFQSCEKNTSSVFNILYILKSLRYLQKLNVNYLRSELHENEDQSNIITRMFNSPFNFKMIIANFEALHETQVKNFYQDIIFHSVLNYSQFQNQHQWQQRFLQFFMNDKRSEYFFKFIHQSFQISIEQLKRKHTLEKFKKRNSDKHTHNKVYYQGRYLESDLLVFLIQLCHNPSAEMKHILRKQPKNNRHYNVILIVTKFFSTLLKHIEIPLILDLAEKCIEFLILVIQGPIFENQKILLENKIFPISREILEINYDYDYGEKSKKLNSKGTNGLSQTTYIQRYLQNQYLKKNILKLSNQRILKLKNQVLNLLINLLSRHKLDSEIFHQLKREFSPDTFKSLIIESAYFYENGFNSSYNMDVLFVDPDKHLSDQSDKSYYQLEIGFLTFFLLRKIQKSYFSATASFSAQDKDDYYYKNILHLMPPEQRQRTKQVIFLSKLKIFFFGYIQFLFDLFYQCFVFMKKVLKTSQPIENFHRDEVVRGMLEFLEQNSGKIQIVRANQTLQNTYFIKMPYCKFQQQIEKDRFLQTVDRTNAQTKVDGLMKNHRSYIKQMRQDESIQSIKLVGLLSKYNETWAITSFVLSLVINILILFSFYQDTSSTPSGSTTTGSTEVATADTNASTKKLFGSASANLSSKIINTFAVFILVSSIFLIIHHIFSKVPIHYGKAFQPEKYYQIKTRKREVVNYQIQTIRRRIKDLTQKSLRFTNLILSDFLLLYHAACVIFAILGLGSHLFYFSFHLSYFIISSNTLFNVLRAIWDPKFKILMTLVLFFLIEYIFAIIGYSQYRDQYPENNCQNLVRCFIVTVDQTFKQNGGVGSFMGLSFPPYHISDSDTIDQDTVSYSRVVYDFVFNFVLIILIVQMMSGIIIDKFGELREQDDFIERDSKTTCFICGQSKEKIERVFYEGQRGGFNHHIYFEHNMWNYIYFSAYLNEKRKKQPYELREMEKELVAKIDNYDNSWIPAFYNWDQN